MNIEPITCQFVFNPQELRRATRCYWRYSPLKWWFLGLFLFLTALALNPYDFPGTTPEETYSVFTVFTALIPVIAVSLFIAGLTFFQTSWVFRKSAYFNQPMAYAFYEDGIHLNTPRVQSNTKWDVFPKVIENQNGFVLLYLGRRSFSWLPKSGFTSPQSIDQCRELMRRKVKDARRLNQGQAGG